jgi:hypothetical protein
MHPDPHEQQIDGERLIAEQRAETGGSGTVGPSVAALPDSMSRGLWRGGFAGAVVGAVLLTPLAFIPFLDMPVLARLVIVWVVGAAAGAAAGAVFFGGAVAETESEDNDYGDEGLVPDQMHRSGGRADEHVPRNP